MTIVSGSAMSAFQSAGATWVPAPLAASTAMPMVTISRFTFTFQRANGRTGASWQRGASPSKPGSLRNASNSVSTASGAPAMVPLAPSPATMIEPARPSPAPRSRSRAASASGCATGAKR